MEKEIIVKLQGADCSAKENESVYSLVQRVCDSPESVILCRVNGILKELTHRVSDGDAVETVTYTDEAGMRAYERGIQLVFLKALYSCVPHKDIKKASLDYGIGRTVFCTVKGFDVTEELLEDIKQHMRNYISNDFRFQKKTLTTAEAIGIFEKVGMKDKAKLLKFRMESNTNVYFLDNFCDYFYGYMPYSTGSLKVFDVRPYHDGILLVFPSLENPDELGEPGERTNFFKTISKSSNWAADFGIATVGDLNEYICNHNPSDLVLAAETFHEKRLGEIADAIKRRGGVKFVMIAGPSSSGKTTFSHRLSIHLTIEGFKPHPIALDDFYVERVDTPKDENGEYDFECLEAVDLKFFNETMTRLLNGETVEMPTFNFKTGHREFKGDMLTLGKDDILVIEGIHGINDKLSYSLPQSSKFKIYISALTQINIDEHNRISTTESRLLRRMIRDARTRNIDPTETIRRWPSVRRGERNNIFPYQESADVMFNSALLYELAVIKQYAEPLLFSIKEDSPEYEKANSLLKFLSYFLTIHPEDIPKHSIIREFIGGSYFNV
ncbi:MAG: nucleoside kinase [Lachnospiraceae bacterium]|nr:nucleoside kinase [Lachnospiraceae bacterium]